jgi:hypothetical protein
LLPSPRRGRPPGKLGSGSTNRPLWESGFAIIVLDSATCLDPIEWFISGHPEICNDAIGCGLHQFGGGEVADPVAGLDRGHTQAIRVWLCRCRPAPTRHRFSWVVIHSRLAR